MSYKQLARSSRSDKWILIAFLVLGYSISVPSVYGQESMIECNQQILPPIGCPSSGGSETNGDVDTENIEEQIPSGPLETNNDIDEGNIESQIPSVIPFP
ncbi:MAG: hypothetical protein WA941_09205 [Nitrososphaeraceae archaeon]